MGALTAPRVTPEQLNAAYQNLGSVGLASGAVVFAGGLLVGKTIGTGNSLRGVPGQAGTGLKVLGIVDTMQPNLLPNSSYVSTLDGSPAIQFRRGTFKLDIDPLDPVTIADLWNGVYITDDHTVKRSWNGGTAAGSLAGTLVGIDDATDPTGAGAWVAIGVLPTSAPNPTGLFLP